ncbi:uvi-1 protein [Colletotrichum incanum]|uniref:Uvi-1 protein n=1 Tax=Colletotrichum incanum TaxID=1573173 RepID=A0A166LA63_COLIC|nr:uvi-1 protein [Colletotrichum incanum]OHW97346.1 hypothetical protein CSPAE12_03919 [Colletotrichum incanum]
MQFSTIKYAVAVLAAFSSSVLSQTTPEQVVQNIRTVTTKSQALQAPAQSITIINGPLIVVGLGPFPPIIAGFADIVSTATTAIAQMQGMPPVPAGRQSDLIFEAFREFVRVHQVLLNILIGKAGLFNTVPIIGQPVAAVLRQVEAIVDTIAFGLIDNVQSRANDLRDEANKLSGTLTLSIDAYDGVSL